MQRLHVRGRHVRDVGAAFVDRVDLAIVEVDAGGVEAGSREFDGERQTDVSQPDDAGAGGAGLDLFQQRGGERGHHNGSSSEWSPRSNAFAHLLRALTRLPSIARLIRAHAVPAERA